MRVRNVTPTTLPHAVSFAPGRRVFGCDNGRLRLVPASGQICPKCEAFLSPLGKRFAQYIEYLCLIPIGLPMRTIKTQILTILALLCFTMFGIGGVGYYAADVANKGLKTVFNDRVVPLRDLKAVSDLYAVNIVDTAHKVRNGNIDWAAGVTSITSAAAGLREHWRAYMATYLPPEEKRLAVDAE